VTDPLADPDFGKVVLFLDVDGVLNRSGASREHLFLDKVALLREIVETTNGAIVVSSTWRRLRNRMFELWAALGPDMKERWLGNTPILSGQPRGNEIQAWLDAHPEVERFVILDDDSDMGELMPHLVRTHCFTGLTPELANEVRERLLGASCNGY
jgi:hypothetical protein